jgi:transposase
MAEKEDIREKYFNKEQSISEIAQHSGKDRKTVRKYVNQENWNAQPSVPRKGRVSKLDPYKGTILQWIEDDRKMRKKQRHTAKRVYDRLVELYDGDGFDCSYRTVADYVSEVKKQVYGKRRYGLSKIKAKLREDR